MSTSQEFKHVQIFQYGLNQNNVYIPQSCVEDNAHTFINVPICYYTKDDPYNNSATVFGIIKAVTEFRNNVVYGDIVVFSKYCFNIVKLIWRNYEIGDVEWRVENGIYCVDKFKLLSVAYDVEKEYKEDRKPNLEVFNG
jgi:hypothetical protein